MIVAYGVGIYNVSLTTIGVASDERLPPPLPAGPDFSGRGPFVFRW
jgi:hypothetical protein